MKLRLLLFLCIVFTFAITEGNAQKKEENKSLDKQESNSYRPYSPEERSEVEKKHKRSRKENRKEKKDKEESFSSKYYKSLNTKVEEFHERQEDNAKRDRKMKRKMEHPQYSDFSYFGHKKPPKKRPVGKRKHCKECGIVH